MCGSRLSRGAWTSTGAPPWVSERRPRVQPGGCVHMVPLCTCAIYGGARNGSVIGHTLTVANAGSSGTRQAITRSTPETPALDPPSHVQGRHTLVIHTSCPTVPPRPPPPRAPRRARRRARLHFMVELLQAATVHVRLPAPPLRYRGGLTTNVRPVPGRDVARRVSSAFTQHSSNFPGNAGPH